MTYTCDRDNITRNYKRVMASMPGEMSIRYRCLNKRCYKEIWFKGRYNNVSVVQCNSCGYINELTLPRRF